MEKYYRLEKSSSHEIGKSYPQCKGMPGEYDSRFFERPNSMTKLNSDFFPKFEPELIFELESDAFITNVISPWNIWAKGFLIDSKVKRIFEYFNLCKHRYYDAEIINSNGIKYQWLHLIYNNYESIDFLSSTFFTAISYRFKINDLDINSFEEFEICLREVSKINYSKMFCLFV